MVSNEKKSKTDLTKTYTIKSKQRFESENEANLTQIKNHKTENFTQ